MNTKTSRTSAGCGLLSALICTGCPIGYGSIGDSSGSGDSSESGDSTGPGQEGGTLGIDAGDPEGLPEAPELALSLSQVKQFDFEWVEASGAEFYQLLESADTGEPFVPVGDEVLDLQTSLTVPLHFRLHASYKLLACNDNGCSESNVVEVMGSLVDAIGYVKGSDSGASDLFGSSVALSGDGRTLAVGAYQADSNGNDDAGAVYVFVRDDLDAWSQQARIEAANGDANDHFGISVSLSADGDTLAIGAWQEDSGATGIGGDSTDDSSIDAGAVYVFARDGQDAWSESAFVKASNTDAGDNFGWSVALSGDGATLAVGAFREASSATGMDGNQSDDSLYSAGAVYVFTRGQNAWSQEAYVKSSNAGEFDSFGVAVALSSDGNTLAVGAAGENSGATGIDGDQTDDSVENAGAAYVFARDGQSGWAQTAYVKASNPDVEDIFGSSVALSGDGETLAVGTDWEDSSATGIGGDDTDNQLENAGAVYVFVHKNAAWLQEAYVKPSNPGDNDFFGHSLALSSDGDTLAVGASVEDSGAVGIGGDQQATASGNGATYVFVRDGAWSQVTYVKASNSGAADYFGYGVALSSDGHTLAVGAYGEDSLDESNPDSGAVYLY